MAELSTFIDDKFVYQSKKSKKARENEDDHPVDDEARDDDEENGAQNSQSSRSECGDMGISNTPENGIVESVELKNFMCHQNLRIDFGEKINFVLGRNGSGKSAVMVGIAVGLGGSAAHTNRAQNLGRLVKKGCPLATVTVRLCNSECDPFRHSQFGNSVVVERKITDDGKSQYKLKSHNGQTVSTRKEDLVDALDHFNIQVNNPVSLLNQDTSRNFLHSSKPRDKYKLFMKATQLEQLNTNYQEIFEQRRIMATSLKQKRESLPELEREVVQWEEKFQNLTQLDRLAESKQELVHEIAWAQVIGLERERDKMAREIAKIKRSVPKYANKVEQCKLEVVKGETSIRGLEDDLNAVNQEAEELQKRQREVEEDLKKKKDARSKAKRDLHEIEHEIHGEERIRNELQNRLEEMQNMSMKPRENEQMRRRAQQELQNEVTQLQNDMADSQKQKTNLESNIDQTVEQLHQIQRNTECSKQQVDRCTRELSGLERNRGDKLQVYGDWMPHLVSAINKEKNFHQKPRGPLGRYLELRDPKWALGMEVVLRRKLLSSFCCHDQHDFQLLRRLMDTCCPREKPDIIKQTFRDQRYNIAHARPRSDQPTFFDIVGCSDLVVFNALIDQRGVEGILMIEREDVAKRVMHINTPRGAKEAFTQQGDQLYGRPNRFYSGRQDRARFIQQSVEGRIAEVKEQLDESRHALQQQLQEKQRLTEEKGSLSRELEQVKVQLHCKEHQINQIRGELQELELIDDVVNSVAVAGLQDELEQHNDQFGILTQQSQTLKEMTHQYDEQKAEFNAGRLKAQETLDKMDQIKSKIGRLVVDVSTAEGHQRHYEEKHRELMEGIASRQEEFDRMDKRVREDTAKAESICERIKTQRTVKDLESELNQKETVIAEEERRQGSREEIVRTYNHYQDIYDETVKTVKSLQRCLVKLDIMMERRVKQQKVYQPSLALRIKVLFQSLLLKRGYRGVMKFDHEKELLNIEVKVEETKRTAMTKDMKALSGGERSFTTVCLILSLWGTIESPFRILDEFDVFMDMVNRRVSMAMLLKAAREQCSKQYIFLTPQDLSAHIGAVDVRTHRLHDPDRNQGTLNFDRTGSSRDD